MFAELFEPYEPEDFEGFIDEYLFNKQNGLEARSETDKSRESCV